MNEFEELCDKIELAAREAVAAAGCGNWRRATVELGAAAYLARDAEKIAARQVQAAVGPTELPDRTVAQSEPQVKDVLDALGADHRGLRLKRIMLKSRLGDRPYAWLIAQLTTIRDLRESGLTYAQIRVGLTPSLTLIHVRHLGERSLDHLIDVFLKCEHAEEP